MKYCVKTVKTDGTILEMRLLEIYREEEVKNSIMSYLSK